MTRQLQLNAFLKPAGEYLAGWRHPDSPPDAGVNFPYVARLVRHLEAAKFDAVFIPDLAGLPDAPPAVLERVAVVNDTFEPISLLSALVPLTTHIGLFGTVSTSYSDPVEVARTFATLHALSGGRAGWNAVTSLNHGEAVNFGGTSLADHASRYARAEEFADVVLGLWGKGGQTPFGHHGPHFTLPPTRPLVIPGQRRPLIAQAGASGEGRQFAARVAEVIFTNIREYDGVKAYRADLRRRAEAFGRHPDDVVICPNLETVIAPSREEAQDKFGRLKALLHPRVALGDVEYWLGGVSLTDLPLDAPLPALPATEKSVSTQQRWYRQAQEQHLTIRDLVNRIADGNQAVIGTPQDVADHIEHWFTTGAADGFNVAFPYLPTTLTDFTRWVIPELQRRGLFRTEYGVAPLRRTRSVTVTPAPGRKILSRP